MDKNSLAHTRWECKYHVVFAPQISSSGNIQRCQSRCRADTGNIVQEKRNRNNRGTVHARPCTYADTNSTEILSVRNNGIFKGEKFAHDIREICEFKVQVREPSFLVSWILRRHSGKEYSGNQELYPESNKRGFGIRPDDVSRVYRPVYG